MADDEIACPKCRQPMERGYLHDDFEVAHWHAGPYGYLRAIFRRWSRERRPVTTYRCSSCGYLESYALPQQD